MDGAVVDLKAGGVSVASVSTVSDLRVLGPDPERLLCVLRPFAPGEAYADRRPQLDFLRRLAASGEFRVALRWTPTFPTPTSKHGHPLCPLGQSPWP